MPLKLSPDKKRVHCDGCRQFQPVMTRSTGVITMRGGIQKRLVCSACLHVVSDRQKDIEEAQAAGIIKGNISAADDRFSAKPLPEPTTETRPAGNEGTR